MSGDLPVEDDVVVRTALQLLPVPSHGDGFWSRLDDSLTATGAPGPQGPREPVAVASPTPAPVLRPITQPVEVVELHHDDASLKLVPPALRRRSNAVAALAAVAAAVVVVVAGAALLRDRSTSVDTAEVAAPSSTTDPESDASATSQPSLESAPATGDPSQAVLSWVSAIEQGDGGAAWDAMGPGAKAYLGTKADFEGMLSALAEGYGAWAAATPDAILITPLSASDGESEVVVTLIGEVEQEGVRQQRADAFVVRALGDVARIEPFDSAGAVEVVVPDAGSGTMPTVTDGELVVVVPKGAEAPTLRLDDGDTVVCGEAPGTELTELETAEGQRCAYRPAGGIEAGRRILTVAFTAGSGAEISAESVLFEAA